MQASPRTPRTRSGRHGARRARGPLALGVTAVLALTGCGIYPGQAAVVGDTDISPEQVDDTAAVVCLVDTSVGGVQSVARRKAVEFLVGVELVERFGRDEGVLPSGGELSQSPAIEQIQRDAQALPAEVREDYIDTIMRLLASQQTLINAGQGPEVDDPTLVDPDGALAAGSQAYSEWLEGNAPTIAVDPRFGEWEGGQLVPSDSSLSVAVSDEAQQLTSGSGQLPSTQVCS